MTKPGRILVLPLLFFSVILALDCSLLAEIASKYALFSAEQLPIFGLLAIVLIVALPLIAVYFVHSLQRFAFDNPPKQPTLAQILRRASRAFLYALVLLFVFCALCGAIGLIAYRFVLPGQGMEAAQNVVSAAVSVLAIWAIPIPIMLLVRYALYRKLEHPVLALSSFKGLTWLFLTLGLTVFAGVGYLLNLIPSSTISMQALNVLKVFVATVLGALWLFYCSVVAIGCSGSDCKIRPKLA